MGADMATRMDEIEQQIRNVVLAKGKASLVSTAGHCHNVWLPVGLMMVESSVMSEHNSLGRQLERLVLGALTEDDERLAEICRRFVDLLIEETAADQDAAEAEGVSGPLRFKVE